MKRKKKLSPGEIIVQIRKSESVLRNAVPGGMVALVSNSAINFYNAMLESRHVIVEKDFTKISDNKKKAEI